MKAKIHNWPQILFTLSKESGRDPSLITSRAGSQLQALGSGEVKLISIHWCGSFAFGISAGCTHLSPAEPRAGWLGLAEVSQVLKYLGRLRNVSGLKGQTSQIWAKSYLTQTTGWCHLFNWVFHWGTTYNSQLVIKQEPFISTSPNFHKGIHLFYV